MATTAQDIKASPSGLVPSSRKPRAPRPDDAPATVLIEMPAAMDLPLLLQSAEATRVANPKAKDDKDPGLAAYEITFKAVVPESLAAAIFAALKEHRLTVAVRPAPADAEKSGVVA